MSAAAEWLRASAGGAPESLLAEMVAALPTGETAVPGALAAGALALYRQVAAGGGGREDALPLLAADALLTQAFEAQAELDPSRLADAAARWGGAGWLGEVADEL